jgi:hypothetical protein
MPEGQTAMMLTALRSPGKTVRAFAADPTEFWIKLTSRLRELPEAMQSACPYVPQPEWRQQLHAELGLTHPCPSIKEVDAVWQDVLQVMRGRGVKTGPMSYHCWNDGDPAFIAAVWCLTRHLNARKVVETGVAHGVTSRFVLEALTRNVGGGHLWSIDLPPQLHPEIHSEIGIAVGHGLRDRWTYITGSSRRRLPDLLADIGPIDLFVHDSAHTTDNVLFEMRQAWASLRPGGAIVADDIDLNWGFQTFCASVPHQRAWVCESEPIAPDPRRSNAKGLFGIVIKPSEVRFD